MSQPAIFLDDGGVMNDNRARGPQWQRLLGEFFPPRLGGTAEGWARVNPVVANRLFEEYMTTVLGSGRDYHTYWREYQIDWLRGMADMLEVALPPSDDEVFALAEAAAAYVTPRVRSAFPGAVDAIRDLHAHGFTLYTASGERSVELAGYLTGMGVRERFTRLYGPDLVSTFKEGPHYYARIFADAGIAPQDALVVDDAPSALGWACEAGARAVLVGQAADGWQGERIASLASLPTFLHKN